MSKRFFKKTFAFFAVIILFSLLALSPSAKTMELEAKIIGSNDEYFNGKLFVVYTSDALSVAEVISVLPESAQRAAPELGLIDFSSEISGGKIISINGERINDDSSDGWHIAVNGKLSAFDADKHYLKTGDKITVWHGSAPAAIASIDARSASSGIILVTCETFDSDFQVTNLPLEGVTLRWYEAESASEPYTELVTDSKGLAYIPEDELTGGLHRIELITSFSDGLPDLYCENTAVSVNVRQNIDPLYLWIGVVAGSVIIAAMMIYFVKIKK